MDIATFQTLVEESGLPYRVWGVSCAEAASHLSASLGVQLADELSEFVENFGNLSITPFLIAITGSEDGEMTAVSSTNLLRRDGVKLPPEYLRIMEHAGESYFVDASSGEVSAFDSLNIDPAAKTLDFVTFDDFLRWVVKESAAQLHDSRFQF